VELERQYMRTVLASTFEYNHCHCLFPGKYMKSNELTLPKDVRM